jgi:hypothetical protein
LLPFPAEGLVKAFPAFGGDLIRLAGSVKRDGLAYIIHHQLAGIAVRHVALKFFADGRIYCSIHILVQQLEHLFAFHGATDE